MLFILPMGLYGMYMLNKVKSPKLRKIMHYLTITSLILAMFLITQLKTVDFIHFKPQFNEYWLNIFFNSNISTPMHWYYNIHVHPIFVLFIVFLGIFYAINIRNRDITGILMVMAFLIGIYFFIFHFDRYVRPRYIYYLLIFFIFILGFGIYSIYNLIPHKKSNIIILTVVIFLLFNPFNAYYAVTYDKHGYVPITNEYHDDVSFVVEAFKDKIKADDVVITSLPNMLFWYFDRPINDPNIYKWKYKHDNRFENVSRVVSENTEGWIILDSRRNGHWTKGLPKNDFETGNKEVKLLGKYRGFYVYRWQKT